MGGRSTKPFGEENRRRFQNRHGVYYRDGSPSRNRPGDPVYATCYFCGQRTALTGHYVEDDGVGKSRTYSHLCLRHEERRVYLDIVPEPPVWQCPMRCGTDASPCSTCFTRKPTAMRTLDWDIAHAGKGCALRQDAVLTASDEEDLHGWLDRTKFSPADLVRYATKIAVAIPALPPLQATHDVLAQHVRTMTADRNALIEVRQAIDQYSAAGAQFQHPITLAGMLLLARQVRAPNERQAAVAALAYGIHLCSLKNRLLTEMQQAELAVRSITSHWTRGGHVNADAIDAAAACWVAGSVRQARALVVREARALARGPVDRGTDLEAGDE